MSTYLSIPKITANWLEGNQSYLMRAISHVEEILQHHIHQVAEAANNSEIERSKQNRGLEADSENFVEDSPNFYYPTSESGESLFALEQLCNIFNLSLFERNVLLLCAGRELDRSWSSLFVKAQSDDQQDYPTFSLALEVLAEQHWSALMPNASLRRWRLIEVEAGNTFTTSPLRIDERILHHLMGVQHLDERLTEMELPIPVTAYLVSSHQYVAQQLADTWLQALNETKILPVLQVCGTDVESKLAIASNACTVLGLNLYAISAEAIPTNTNQLIPI